MMKWDMRLLLVLSFMKYSSSLPDTIPIGGLFHPADDKQEIAFRYAVEKINSDRAILPRSKLSAQIEKIPPQDSFHASKKGVKALKDVAVTIPPAARIMDTVTLQCRYDLEGEPLYTVKWYKGSKEFYRYIPKEHPDTQIFPLPGIDVDLNKSTPTEVVLRNVQPEVSGKYKCEVSSDAPNFYTQIVSGYMYVIDVPESDPELLVDKRIVEIGYTVKANCTSPPSFPAMNVTWFLNKRKINETNLKRIAVDPHMMAYNNRRTPLITVSKLELEIDGNTFQGGKATLLCVATVFHLYKREMEIILEEERPRPRPSSVLGTREAASDSLVTNPKMIVTFLLVIISLLR